MEKKKPSTEYEKQLLIQLVQPHISKLDNRRTDAVTIKEKHQAWENLAQEFNNSPNVSNPVTSKQLKKMWQNLKSKAREAKTIENQRNFTGGGPQPPEMGPLESQVLSVMPNVMPTIDIAIDSDILYVEDQHTDNDNDSEAWLQKKNREHFPTHCTSSEPEHHARTIKRKAEENIEDIKRKIYLAELENTTAKAALERKLMLEKHEVELEILKLKKEIVSKQLEDAKCR